MGFFSELWEHFSSFFGHLLFECPKRWQNRQRLGVDRLIQYACFSHNETRCGWSKEIINLSVSISLPSLINCMCLTFITSWSTITFADSFIVELKLLYWPLFIYIVWGLYVVSFQHTCHPYFLFALFFFSLAWLLICVVFNMFRFSNLQVNIFTESNWFYIAVNIYSQEPGWIIFWESICIYLINFNNF